MLITFEMLGNAIYNLVILLWNTMMVILLFFAMAILITGTIFMFRAAFMLWFDGMDPFEFISILKNKVTEFLHNTKNKIKGLVI